MALACSAAGICGGCSWFERPYSEQLRAKVESLETLWKNAGLDSSIIAGAHLWSVGEEGLRDRLDLQLRAGGVIGLHPLEHRRTSATRPQDELVALGDCPMATPSLRRLLDAIVRDPPPLQRASLRLRVGVEGARGIWLEAANADIKGLLEQRDWLVRRLEAGDVVELGQQRKPVAMRSNGLLHLRKEHELVSWFATFSWRADLPWPLYGSVGGFTQPSVRANRALVTEVGRHVAGLGGARWLELGAGNGNFTLPLAEWAAEPVVAVEADAQAREALLYNAAAAGLDTRVELALLNMHHVDAELVDMLSSVDGVLADPPRSGLGATTVALATAARRPALVYVSCHAESLVADAHRLSAMGYRLTRISGVDQFPQTPHAEWITSWCAGVPDRT